MGDPVDSDGGLRKVAMLPLARLLRSTGLSLLCPPTVYTVVNSLSPLPVVDAFSPILPVPLGAGSDPAYHERSTTLDTTPLARIFRRLGSSTV